jgi:hypothetical protein
MKEDASVQRLIQEGRNMIRMLITVFLLIASLLVSCAQPTLAPPHPVSCTYADGTCYPAPFETSSAPVIGPVEGVIEFAGQMWNVKAGCGLGPGPNCWSDSAESVWVQEGQLHLKVRKVEGRWYSAEVSTVECTQYGIHRFFVNTELDPRQEPGRCPIPLYRRST